VGDLDSSSDVADFEPMTRYVERLPCRYAHRILGSAAVRYRSSRDCNLGFLTGVTGLTNTITYHESGMVESVPHVNGVTDWIDVDPAFPSRPERFYTTGATGAGGGDWTSKLMTFDGSGNIKSHFDGLHDPLTQWVDYPYRTLGGIPKGRHHLVTKREARRLAN